MIESGKLMIEGYKDIERRRNKDVKKAIFENLQEEIKDLIVNKKIFQTDGQEIIKAWKWEVGRCKTYEDFEELYNELINYYKQNFKNKKIEKENNRQIVYNQLAEEIKKLKLPFEITIKILDKFNKKQKDIKNIEELLKLKNILLEKYIQNQKKEDRNELKNIFFENLQIEIRNNPNKNYILEFWKDNEQQCITIDDFKDLYNLILTF